MDIKTYRLKHELSQADFAAMLENPPATQGLVSHWETGRRAITAERAVQIEEATGGKINRADLRPKLFKRATRRKVA